MGDRVVRLEEDADRLERRMATNQTATNVRLDKLDKTITGRLDRNNLLLLGILVSLLTSLGLIVIQGLGS